MANNYLEGGIRVTGGSVSLTNVVMHANGYDIEHIDLGPNTSASLNYVVALLNGAGGVSCGYPTSSYSIRHSIVDPVTCPMGSVEIDQSLVGEGLEDLGDGNVVFPPGDYAQVFVDHPGGDLHIGPTPPKYLLGIATRSATDPARDLDGDPRPDVGKPYYPGPDAP